MHQSLRFPRPTNHTPIHLPFSRPSIKLLGILYHEAIWYEFIGRLTTLIITKWQFDALLVYQTLQKTVDLLIREAASVEEVILICLHLGILNKHWSHRASGPSSALSSPYKGVTIPKFSFSENDYWLSIIKFQIPDRTRYAPWCVAVKVSRYYYQYWGTT